MNWPVIGLLFGVLALSLGALFMAVTTFRKGGHQRDGLGGSSAYAGGGCRATLLSLAFLSFVPGGLFVAYLLLRNLLFGPPELVDEDSGPKLAESPAPDPVDALPAPDVVTGSESEPPRIGEVVWDPHGLPDELPAMALRMVLDGAGLVPGDVAWSHQNGAYWLGIYRTSHADCYFDWWGEDGFTVRLGADAPEPGARFERLEKELTLQLYDSPSQAPDMTGAAEVHLPGETSGTRRTSLAGAVATQIDAVEATRIRGRLYIASREDDRSLLVGAFSARRCDMSPP